MAVRFRQVVGVNDFGQHVHDIVLLDRNHLNLVTLARSWVCIQRLLTVIT